MGDILFLELWLGAVPAAAVPLGWPIADNFGPGEAMGRVSDRGDADGSHAGDGSEGSDVGVPNLPESMTECCN